MHRESKEGGERAPRITIGLPVYNGENYLAEAIESLLTQSYPDFELILADNASTDRTRAICEEYARLDARVRYARAEKNLGAAWNYNRLVGMARGEFFKWQAHDDACLPDFLARCIDALDRNPDAVLCYPSTEVIDADGRVMSIYRDGLALPQERPSERLVAYLKANFMRRNGMCNPIFGLIRSDVLRRTRLIQDFPASDQSLLGHFALLGKSIELPEVQFRRRIHPRTSTMANRSGAALRAWFNPAAGTSRWQALDTLRNSRIARRITQFRDFYRAISELVDDPSERRACRQTLHRLILTDPKWIYIDLKYSLGFAPDPARIMQSLEGRQV